MVNEWKTNSEDKPQQVRNSIDICSTTTHHTENNPIILALWQCLPLGKDPIAVEGTPAYIPRKPPALLKPWGLCSRVLMVSRGNNIKSTETPATPPAFKKKRGWGRKGKIGYNKISSLPLGGRDKKVIFKHISPNC